MALDFSALKKLVDEDHRENSSALAFILRNLCHKALEERDIDADFGDKEAFTEIAQQIYKDWQRLRLYQDDNVDLYKFAGYMGFWVRKLKPFRSAYTPRGMSRTSAKRVHDVNEQLSIWIMGALVTRLAASGQVQPSRPGLAGRFQRFYANQALYDYTVHSMRTRTFGPHHYVILLHTIDQLDGPAAG